MERIYKTIYPNKCLLCCAVMDDKDGVICFPCGQGVYKVGSFNARCSNIDESFVAFEYCEKVRESVFRFKYDGIKSLAQPMSTEMIDHISENCDFLMPVPLHPTRLKERGYNQSALLAMEMGILLGMPSYDGLERLRYTEKQFGLNPQERLENLDGAMEVKNDFNVKGKHIVLVDDIFTTGSTAAECGRALKVAGAEKVDLVVFAVAQL